MTIYLKRGFVGTMVWLLLAGCATTMPPKPATTARGDYAYTKAYASWLIRAEMAKQQVTGLSIALVDDQQVVWAEGFGFADKAAAIPATPETIYRAGSITKLFTATTALQLVDDGLLNLDQPLQRYLPEFAIKSRFPEAAPITPRAILTHHSGLPSDLLKGMWTATPGSLAEETQLLREEYLAYPPGYVFSYSNAAVALLGHALEKITDRDIAAQMSIALFLPLRMTSTTLTTKIDRSPLASKAYRNNEEAPEPPLRDIPAGGLNTSVLDLSRFMAMVFGDGWYKGHQILRQESLKEMLRPQNSRVPLDLSFRVGLGWMLGSIGGMDIKNAGPVAHHGGATINHRSQLVILPEQKLGVVVLANSASAGALAARVATETLKLALEAKTGISQPERQPAAATELPKPAPPVTAKPASAGQSAAKAVANRPAKAERTQLTAAELQAYEGRYDTIAGLAQLRKKGDTLDAELSSGTIRLTPRPDGLLAMSYRLLGLFPVSLGELDTIAIDREKIAGRDLLKAVIDGSEYLAGERLEPAVVPAVWQQRAGEYEIVNYGDDTRLVEDIVLDYADGLLTVAYRLPHFSEQTLHIALAPLSATEAVISGLGRGKGETIRVVTVKGEELLAYSGYLLRKKAE